MSGGRAKINDSDTASSANTKSGMRLKDIPGARFLKIVTMKFSAPAVVDIPLKINPSA